MAINIAARRGAKNQRRKAVVAQKRKAELETGTMAGRVRLAAADPIQHCRLSESTFETGMGILVVARGATPYSLTMATFLLDTFALGVKDTYIRSVSGETFAEIMEHISLTGGGMAPVEPAYARKLLHDLVAWSRTVGFAPHRDYPKLEPIFGTVSTTGCETEFKFGHEGKPFLIGDLGDMKFTLIDDDSPDAGFLEHTALEDRHSQAD
jgi:hypothetical protein